ncbi:SH3 domain-containing protein [Rhizobiaceae bacterium n13]|uniref:SH3 domain-containing protein n=2 Tax=Ferirhizobium litorale TaxID=2927786 RepID=A0AAE3U614_9HYPH|nr:SH3 domain-containing protein [Fererhizobium litorale]MDI7864251.1 SH3 domain-containing protein [Fererhizobium litorale]MDI7924644.1 SH3 domain-containing protein [Fererhizobium litorale]
MLSNAAQGYATANVNLRAGPSTDYPAVTVIPYGAPVTIFGCLPDAPWCDTSYAGIRGWVSGNYLQTVYQQRRVYVGPEYYAPLGIPVIGFTFDTYWDRYYRNRPFYRERNRWHDYHVNRPNRPPGYRPPPNRPPEARPPSQRPPGARPPGQRPPQARPSGQRPPQARPDRDRRPSASNNPDRRPQGNRQPPPRETRRCAPGQDGCRR